MTETPIVFTLQINGETIVKKGQNVLKALRSIDIPLNSIKTMAVLNFELNGNVYHRILRVQHMRMLLGNVNRQLATAKIINTTLGLSGEDLYK